MGSTLLLWSRFHISFVRKKALISTIKPFYFYKIKVSFDWKSPKIEICSKQTNLYDIGYIKFLVKYLEDAELDHLAQLHPELMSRLARSDLDIFDIMEDLDLVGDFYFLNKLVLNDGTEIRGAQITFLIGPRITILYTLRKKVTLYSENIKERLLSF